MGTFITDLADVARLTGLPVVEVPGWQSRGWRGGTTPDGGFLGRPQGGLAHHTGTPNSRGGDYPTLSTVVYGRSDVAGPLANLGLGRNGTVYVIAAGRANHSGAVDDQRYFNAHAIGIEAEHPGGSEPWSQEQYDAYVLLCRVLGQHYGITWRGHKEAAIPHGRKPDPNFDMDAFRAAIAAGGGAVPVGNPIPPSAPKGYVQHGDRGALVTELQQLLIAAGFGVGAAGADGIFGDATEAAVRSYQASRGLNVDGVAGAQTFGALRSGQGPAAPPAPPTGPIVIAPGVPAPPFPLPDGHCFGPKSGPDWQHSGYYNHREDLRTWQQRMADRGWAITADGLYGDQTAGVTKAFQSEKGLTVDGLIGPITWSSAWTLPVTR